MSMNGYYSHASKIGAWTAIIINGVIRYGAGSTSEKAMSVHSRGIAGSHSLWMHSLLSQLTMTQIFSFSRFDIE